MYQCNLHWIKLHSSWSWRWLRTNRTIQKVRGPLRLQQHCKYNMWLLILDSYTVNIAPVFPTLDTPDVNFTLPFLSHNPRCLKRDISVWTSSRWSRDIDSYNLIVQNPDIYWFQTIMQGNGFINGFLGVHSGGQNVIYFSGFRNNLYWDY